MYQMRNFKKYNYLIMYLSDINLVNLLVNLANLLIQTLVHNLLIQTLVHNRIKDHNHHNRIQDHNHHNMDCLNLIIFLIQINHIIIIHHHLKYNILSIIHLAIIR